MPLPDAPLHEKLIFLMPKKFRPRATNVVLMGTETASSEVGVNDVIEIGAEGRILAATLNFEITADSSKRSKSVV